MKANYFSGAGFNRPALFSTLFLADGLVLLQEAG
jgi:hypothetical protein